ncbi:MAG: dihydroorotate dehydrogenase [Oscillospiraceae bacterium]|nr:dihydroorotate dehydrogenase [Oscillospiraceae bacterium]
MADMSVKIAGVSFKNPLIVASGCVGFGREYAELYPLGELGGISTKGTTIAPRMGNATPRIAEGESVILNSVGLQNPGVDYFIKYELPWLSKQGTVVISNVAGSEISDYIAVCEKLNDTAVDMIELNISCPNVKHGGAAFGTSCEAAAEITKEVRAHCKKPLMVKLSPNVTSIGDIAAAVESEGADAVSLINTLTGMKIDIRTRRPILKNNTGGMSGSALLPLAVKMVWEVSNRVKIPVVGLGGISKWQDAVEIMLAGATAFQVGTANFTDPYAPIKILSGLEKYLDDNRLATVSELTGKLRIWE